MLAAAVILAAAVLAVAVAVALRQLARGRRAELSDDLVVRSLRPHGNVERVEVDE